MKTKITIGIVAAAAGAALGYLAAPRQAVGLVTAADDGAEKGQGAMIADIGDQSAVNALRARIRELESKLAAKGGEIGKALPAESVKGTEPETKGAGPFTPPKMSEIRARIEEWKKNNPEEAARMEKHFTEMRQRRAERTQGKLDFLASISTDGMSDEGRRNHEKLQDLIERRQALQAKLEDLDLSDEDRESAMREMFELHGEMNEANRIERTSLINQMMGELGLGADDAAEVSDTIKAIYEATTEGHHGGMPPPPNGIPGGPSMAR